MKQELESRTKRFALAVIAAVGELKKSQGAEVLGYQLLKSGTAIATGGKCNNLLSEARELLAIFVASGRTAKSRR